ncbi:Protein-lysine methyltransferase METTL21B [Rhynchospora pubera]|uniref:Protein-lysine methyltransferase METTL21B n=1 Tax=Rhynchospora pubera TaxID=906938 RepID=A0AAV8H5J0_9POAL|nr:Protein-lysine methyltransferase METTL21B [Rhynchospora pubera]KAJ4810533.1 Protein-lysine methyltransferase METTL21B [Rhynchospora pubera]
MEQEQDEDEVMSEVHLGCPPHFTGPFISRFTFSLPSLETRDGNNCCSSHIEVYSSPKEVTFDEDGDLVLDRRKNVTEKCEIYEFSIRHNVTSSLKNVGLQVWKASLVLTDFVLHKCLTSSEFNGVTAIELGAGTGLVGIALARSARSVYITDKGIGILDNCLENVNLCSRLLSLQENRLHVRELDWNESWPPLLGSNDLFQTRLKYTWSPLEIEEAERATVLLAADVIYSDDLTDLFFAILDKLMSRGSEKVLYLALEKRYNFSLDELDVVANGYSHFRRFLKDESDCGSPDSASFPCFVGKLVDLQEIPQYIREYERGKDVEIWKVTYCQKQQN